MVIVYERQQRFNEQVANQMASDLVRGCEAVGMVTQNELGIRLSSPRPTRNNHQSSARAY